MENARGQMVHFTLVTGKTTSKVAEVFVDLRMENNFQEYGSKENLTSHLTRVVK